jgi:small subunit ribosomal protein S5
MAKEMRENNKRAPRKDGFREVEKEFKEELLEVARVTRVTAGGRQLRFRAAVVVGNGKGTVGLGTGKAAEVVVAIEKAVRDAKKNLVTFPIVGGTVPHDVKANFKATSVMLHPAFEGTGIIA